LNGVTFLLLHPLPQICHRSQSGLKIVSSELLLPLLVVLLALANMLLLPLLVTVLALTTMLLLPLLVTVLTLTTILAVLSETAVLTVLNEVIALAITHCGYVPIKWKGRVAKSSQDPSIGNRNHYVQSYVFLCTRDNA
jgi:hypothetical protein